MSDVKELKGLVRKTIASKGENLIDEMTEIQIENVMSKFNQLYRDARMKKNDLRKDLIDFILNFANMKLVDVNRANQIDMEIKAIDAEMENLKVMYNVWFDVEMSTK